MSQKASWPLGGNASERSRWASALRASAPSSPGCSLQRSGPASNLSTPTSALFSLAPFGAVTILFLPGASPSRSGAHRRRRLSRSMQYSCATLYLERGGLLSKPKASNVNGSKNPLAYFRRRRISQRSVAELWAREATSQATLLLSGSEASPRTELPVAYPLFTFEIELPALYTTRKYRRRRWIST
jgi:hypothetical protein